MAGHVGHAAHPRLVHRRLGAQAGPSTGLADDLFGGVPGLWPVVRVSYMFNYINYDDATELLVYAHGTPDIEIAQ